MSEYVKIIKRLKISTDVRKGGIILEHIYDVAIIGGGPAGYTAALYASRAGLDTAIIEKMSIGGQMTLTDEIDNYPGFEKGIDGITLGMKMQESAERFGAKTIFDEVTDVSLDLDIKKITLTTSDVFARNVIIAVGAEPRKLNIEGEQQFIGSGVHYCAHCDGRFYKDKSVVVVGGGSSAATDALYLSKLAKSVTLIHRRDTLRAERIYSEPLEMAKNISFVWDSEVCGFIGDNKFGGVKIKNVKTGEVSDIICDGVFVSIGREPSTKFLQGKIALDKNGYIIADETTKTSISGVFAAGDVRTKELRQIVTAVADGAVAAHNVG